ncbi:probable flavin-containing monoamine oxidase B isoform X2 [Gordionus sp. m RMFG-2023]|uniref:probable flavin-containing monoamine oxidase B isoform X2 n=1 Tax=Gordionus sp. m RMFG-2023 TaxID=3053472 RepID=UPI0031FE3F13
MIQTYDICIIGAGLSGLSAAYYTRKKSDKISLLILEGKDKCGGRLCSTPSFKYGESLNNLELGGEWISRDQVHIDWLLFDLKIDLKTQNHTGRDIWNFEFFLPSYLNIISQGKNINIDRKSLKFIEGNGNTFFNFISNILWKIYLWKVNLILKILNHLNLYKKYNYNMIDNLDVMTMKSYSRKFINWLLLSKLRIDVMNVTHRVLFGTESKRVPFLFYALYSLPLTSHQGSGIYDAFLAAKLKGDAPKRMRIKEGAHTICDKLVESLSSKQNLKISYEKRVESIYQDKDTKNFTITCRNGEVFESKTVIMAIPPVCLKDIKFDLIAPLSKGLSSLFQHCQPGHVIKFVIVFPTPFWRDLKYSGLVVNCPKERPYFYGKNFLEDETTPLEESEMELDLRYSYFCSKTEVFRYKGATPVAPFDCVFDSGPGEDDGTEKGDTDEKILGKRIKYGSLSGFIGGDNYLFWKDKPQKERFVAITSYLNFVWQTTKAKESLHYFEKAVICSKEIRRSQ